jgi:hypothetical protein
MVEPYPYHKAIVAAAGIVAALFWAGLAYTFVTVSNRYLPDAGPWLQAGTTAAVVILIYLGIYIGRARRVAYLHGYAVAIGPKQHPDLHARITAVCKRLDIEQQPLAFIFQDPTLGHSFSLRFAGEHYLALNGELIGALTERQGAIDFYIGYELGHLHDRYAVAVPFLFPATVVPLLGTAYHRARVYSADKFGLAGSKTRVDAGFALAVQASGSRRWKSFNIAEFAGQSLDARRFWMSVADLSSPVPWLAKRVAHLRAIATSSGAFLPRRHLLAYPVAALIPNLSLRFRLAWARVSIFALWVIVLGSAGIAAHHALAQAGFFEFIESRFVNKLVIFPRPASAPAPVQPQRPATPVSVDVYARLDADLRQLGEAALARQKKHGGIICEVGNIDALNLNFAAARYAFSCDEPTVYTVIQSGEFEAGRPSYLRIYNWKDKKLVTGSTAVSAPVETHGDQDAQVDKKP